MFVEIHQPEHRDIGAELGASGAVRSGLRSGLRGGDRRSALLQPLLGAPRPGPSLDGDHRGRRRYSAGDGRNN